MQVRAEEAKKRAASGTWKWIGMFYFIAVQ
jgi:hypothetical protein